VRQQNAVCRHRGAMPGSITVEWVDGVWHNAAGAGTAPGRAPLSIMRAGPAARKHDRTAGLNPRPLTRVGWRSSETYEQPEAVR
jgi:hypothetical protein